MEKIIEMYVLNYGLEETLTLVSEGIANAMKARQLTDDGRKQCNEAATEIFRLRNNLR